MEPNSPEHFGWSAMCAEANGCFPTREAFMKGIAAYEAARPKLPTITGMPEMVGGKRVVGWKWAVPVRGDVVVSSWYAPTSPTLVRLDGPYVPTCPFLIAITEADNDRS